MHAHSSRSSAPAWRDSIVAQRSSLRSPLLERRFLMLAGLLLLLCVYVGARASDAHAARPHEFTTTFGEHCLAEPCTGAQLLKPSGVAVNEATGDVYVVDTGEAGQNGRVARFSSAGAFQSEFNGSGLLLNGEGEAFEGKAAGSGGLEGEVPTGRFEEPEGIAVDNDPSSPSYQDVYVADVGHFVVDKYSPEGEYLGQISVGGESGGRIERVIDGVAVDAAGDVWVYLNEASLSEYSSATSNEFVSPAKPVTGLAGFAAPGLAVDSAGNFYVGEVNEPETRIAKTNASGKVVAKDFDNKESSAVAVDQTTNDAYIDNLTSIAAFNPATEELESFGDGHLTQGSGIGVNAATNTLYVADPLSGPVVVFGPAVPSTPRVESESLAEVSANSAVIGAQVNPRSEVGEAPTEYSFQYGRCSSATTCSSSGYEEVPGSAGQIEADFEGHAVSVKLKGLLASSTYHFRVAARNSHSAPGVETLGEERTFTTEASGGELVLPDNRGWELVSPPDKHGSLIEPISEAGVVQAAAGGNGITYLANAPTEAQPAGYTNQVQVLSRRGSASWSSSDIAIAHPGITATGYSIAEGPEYRLFDSELSQSIVQPFGEFVPQLSEEASESTAYLHNLSEGCGAHCFRPLVTGKPGFANVEAPIRFGEAEVCRPRGEGLRTQAFCGPQFLGASPDLSHVVLVSAIPLQAGLEGEGLYEWSGGSLAPVSLLPDGSPAPEPALGTKLSQSARNAISSDGSRVIWRQEPHLYQREMDLDKTVELDEGDCESCESGGGQFQIASADGSRVLFTDERKLTEDSGASPTGEGEADLYECEIVISEGKAHCNLTDLTPQRNGEGADVQGSVLGASEDAASVYFVAKGIQSEAANARGQKAVSGQPNLYLAHDGQVSFITTLSNGDETDWETTVAYQPTRVSASGQWLELMSQASPTGYDNRDLATGEPVAEVYLFDAASAKLACASCMPSGARPVGVEYAKLQPGNGALVGGPRDIWPEAALVAANVPGWTSIKTNGTARYQPRYLNNEGRLFFNTADALVPQDSNGTQDVYQYEPPGLGSCSEASATYSARSGGCVSLISSGNSAQESAFMDASESGDDVFFLTAAKLAPIDTDAAFDIYDAHVCSAGEPCISYPSTQASSCEGESSCKAPATPQPSIFAAPASATFSGPGNPPPAPAAVVKKKTAAQIKAEQLAKALKSCRAKKNKHKRQACEKEARKKYGPAKKAAAKAKKKPKKKGRK